MEKDLIANGYYRINKLLLKIIESSDKQEVIKSSDNLLDDVGDFLTYLFKTKNITEADIEDVEAEKIAIEEISMGMTQNPEDVETIEDSDQVVEEKPVDQQE